MLWATSVMPDPLRLDVHRPDHKLAGRLLLPEDPGPHPAVIFVHGDGALPWDAHGYYTPFMQALTNAGFAVYAWDKPGVGASTGNWLNQSMQARADEVIAAADTLRSDGRIQPDSIGLLGFSQAGWVMPKAIAAHSDFAYMVSISGAINWIEQSEFMTRNRLRLEGATDAQIREALEFDRLLVDLMSKDAPYHTYTSLVEGAPSCCRSAMSQARWIFAKTNFRSDATAALRHVDIPVLALFGDRDLNVDAMQSAATYRDILGQTPGEVRVVTLKNADHSLLPASRDRLVTSGFGLMKRLIKIDIFGADAFADDAVGRVVRWIAAQE